jgi:hypothetical protein
MDDHLLLNPRVPRERLVLLRDALLDASRLFHLCVSIALNLLDAKPKFFLVAIASVSRGLLPQVTSNTHFFLIAFMISGLAVSTSAMDMATSQMLRLRNALASLHLKGQEQDPWRRELLQSRQKT